jgi:hypothetical protein
MTYPQRKSFLHVVNRLFLVPLEYVQDIQHLESNLTSLSLSYFGGSNKVHMLSRPKLDVDKTTTTTWSLTHVCPFCCNNGSTCALTRNLALPSPTLKNENDWVLPALTDWNFNGAVLKTSYNGKFKNWFGVGDGAAGKLNSSHSLDRLNKPFDGSDYRLVKTFMKYLNFSIDVHLPENGCPLGIEQPDGRWTGCIGGQVFIFPPIIFMPAVRSLQNVQNMPHLSLVLHTDRI